MKLGEVIQLNKDALIEIQDDVEYSILGVKSYGKGVIIKQKVFGKDLNMKKYKVAKKNQLMWCKVDTKNGAFGITKEEHIGCIASTNMALADIDTKKIFPEFLELLFRNQYFYEFINSKSTGTTNRKYLKPTEVCTEIDIPSLSLKEQDLFLKKYNLFQNSKIHKNIELNLLLIQKLRHSILQEAVSGELVPQDPNDEPASELLKKIRIEKERLIREKKIKKDKPLPPINGDEVHYKLPEGWKWIRLGEFFNLKTGATPSTAVPKYWDGEIRWLKSGDVNLGEIYECDGRITEEGMKNSNCKILSIDSVLIALNGQGKTRGTSAMLRVEASCNQSIVAMISYDKLKLIPEYLWVYLRANYMNIREITGHKQRRGLNMGIISNFVVPIPPTNEQKRIVEKVNHLMNLCDQLEKKVKENQKNSELLMDVVLREAFENQ